MNNTTAVLEAKGLGVEFGGLKAVSNFDIQIGNGELVGLIGPNGAGKTTVFNLLTGVYQPTEGKFFSEWGKHEWETNLSGCRKWNCKNISEYQTFQKHDGN